MKVGVLGQLPKKDGNCQRTSLTKYTKVGKWSL